MSWEGLPDTWKTDKFRKSVVYKINEELKEYKLKQSDHGNSIEIEIFQKAQTKRQYLGYVAKIILSIRNMVCIQDAWIETRIKEILTKPPPKLRKVLKPEDLAKYNLEMMHLKYKIEENAKLKFKKL